MDETFTLIKGIRVLIPTGLDFSVSRLECKRKTGKQLSLSLSAKLCSFYVVILYLTFNVHTCANRGELQPNGISFKQMYSSGNFNF